MFEIRDEERKGNYWPCTGTDSISLLEEAEQGWWAGLLYSLENINGFTLNMSTPLVPMLDVSDI